MKKMYMLRWIIFIFGLICGVIAANMFFMNEFFQGFAFLAMSAIFLLVSLLAFLRASLEPIAGVRSRFSASNRDEHDQDYDQDHERDLDYDLAADIMARRELAFFVANLAVQSLKSIGRTIPPSQKEIDLMEDQVTSLLDRVGVHKSDRAQLLDDFDRLRARLRRVEGGRALIRSTRT